MSKAVIKPMVSAEDYLAGEEAAESRHEYVACLIAEVLSPSTEAVDRREKWLAYSELDSLRQHRAFSESLSAIHSKSFPSSFDPDKSVVQVPV